MLLQPKSTGFVQLLQETALTTAAVVYNQGNSQVMLYVPQQAQQLPAQLAA
tara:strand:- start:358 stop:510 length:153 start_codon:yes stop_codon:yes gene_type:complete